MRGHIERRGKSWRIKITQGRDPATKRVRQRWFTYPTRQEAEAHLSQMLTQLHGGGSIPTTRITVGQFLQEWLEKRASAIRPTSHESYVQIVDGHLRPALGTVPLRHLTALDVQGYITTKLQGTKDAKGKWTAKPLAGGTVRKHIAVLREALGHAVKWGLLVRNVCDLVEKPRASRKEMRVWDGEQVQLFLAQAKRQNSPHYPLYVTAITTGLRAGELLGLRWSSVDFLLGTARVDRTFYRMGGKQLFQEPKTEKGRRVVEMLPTVLEVLRDAKAKQDAIKREMGSAYSDLDLVFCQPDGKPLHLHNIVSRDFSRVTKKAKLPRIRFHDLRHSHATDLLAHGEHPKVVSERLGHYDPAFTLRVYSHVLPGMQAQTARRLEARLFGQQSSEEEPTVTV
jgi:integrase